MTVKRALLITAGTAVGLGAALTYTPQSDVQASVVPEPVEPVASSSGAAPAVAPTPPGDTATATGPVVATRYGDVQVQVTVAEGVVTEVTALAFPADDPKSQAISERAVAVLSEEALAAQSADVATVSGATFTSEAWQQSAAAAFAEAGVPATVAAEQP